MPDSKALPERTSPEVLAAQLEAYTMIGVAFCEAVLLAHRMGIGLRYAVKTYGLGPTSPEVARCVAEVLRGDSLPGVVEASPVLQLHDRLKMEAFEDYIESLSDPEED